MKRDQSNCRCPFTEGLEALRETAAVDTHSEIGCQSNVTVPYNGSCARSRQETALKVPVS